MKRAFNLRVDRVSVVVRLFGTVCDLRDYSVRLRNPCLHWAPLFSVPETRNNFSGALHV